MTISNSLNISKAGIIAHDGKGDFLGRKIVGADGISVEHQDGIGGDVKLSVQQATTATTGVVRLADKEALLQENSDAFSRVISVGCLKNHPAMPYLWAYFKVGREGGNKKLILLKGYNVVETGLSENAGEYFVSLKGIPDFKNMPVFCNAWCVEKPKITWQCYIVAEKKGSPLGTYSFPSIKISIFLDGKPYIGRDIMVQVVAYKLW